MQIQEAYHSYFNRHPDAKVHLLQTRDRPLVFADSNEDWGYSAESKKGHNDVGRCLMKVRGELRRGRR